ncbi:alpha/beta hydrolase [Serratia ureilytica]
MPTICRCTIPAGNVRSVAVPRQDRPHTPVASAALPPLLFVAQRYDPTTPYRNAQVMAAAFKSPLITRERDGHTLALNGIDSCVDESVVVICWRRKSRVATKFAVEKAGRWPGRVSQPAKICAWPITLRLT